MIADEFERRGMSPEEARLAARRAYGSVEQAKQAHRDERAALWLQHILQDLRYGVRTLRRTPGFTITAVLTLALGIGACTAIFSLVNAVLLRSLPYGDPGRLVYLYTPTPRYNLPPEDFGPAYGDFYDIKRESRSFQSLTVFEQSMFNLAEQGTAQRVSAARVDGDFFQTFQASPEIGRGITADDNQPGHETVAVISHALWQSMFGSASDILHRSLVLDGKGYQIVGVMPRRSSTLTTSICPRAFPNTRQRKCGCRWRSMLIKSLTVIMLAATLSLVSGRAFRSLRLRQS